MLHTGRLYSVLACSKLSQTFFWLKLTVLHWFMYARVSRFVTASVPTACLGCSRSQLVYVLCRCVVCVYVSATNPSWSNVPLLHFSRRPVYRRQSFPRRALHTASHSSHTGNDYIGSPFSHRRIRAYGDVIASDAVSRLAPSYAASCRL